MKIGITTEDYGNEGGSFPFYWQVECEDFLESSYEDTVGEMKDAIKDAVSRAIDEEL